MVNNQHQMVKEENNMNTNETKYDNITLVVRYNNYEESEDEEGNYTGGCGHEIRVFSAPLKEIYLAIRGIQDYAADMGDGSSANVLCAFWTATREEISVEMLVREAEEVRA